MLIGDLEYKLFLIWIDHLSRYRRICLPRRICHMRLVIPGLGACLLSPKLSTLCTFFTTLYKNLRDSWICFDQTFLGLGLGKSFPARESLVSDIPAGDRNPINLFLQCIQFHSWILKSYNLYLVFIGELGRSRIFLCSNCLLVNPLDRFDFFLYFRPGIIKYCDCSSAFPLFRQILSSCWNKNLVIFSRWNGDLNGTVSPDWIGLKVVWMDRSG